MSPELVSKLKDWRRTALICGGVGLLACIIGAFVNPSRIFVSYLWSYLFWLGLALGSLCLAMIHSLTSGRWGDVTRRFQEAAFSNLPVLALLFIPIFFGLQTLYPWARPAELASEPVLQKRLPYMTTWFFIVRAVFVFVVWNVMAWLFRKWSVRQDSTTDLNFTRKMRVLSGPGLIIYVLTVTIAYVDWVMSLEPKWFSTMFPIIICISQILSALAFSIIMLTLFRRIAPISEVLTVNYPHQLGNLLLAFVMFWTYISFGQLLVIYSGNLPRELGWYLHRIAGNWKWIVGAIALLHFFIPFYALLFRPVKMNFTPLVTLACLLFVMRMVDVFWYVTPTFFPTGIRVSWLDFAAPIGIGGIWVAVFVSALISSNLMPRNDPRIHQKEAAHA